MLTDMISTFPTAPLLPFQGLFEAHITVKLSSDVEQFNSICHSMDIKPIVIQLDRGRVQTQVMTCSRHSGTFQAIWGEVQNITTILKSNDLEITRIKIEAHPDNLGVPSSLLEARELSSENYFEYHLKVLMNPMDRPKLLSICEKYQAHLSHNAFKIRADVTKPLSYENFVTCRSYQLGKKEANQHFEALAQSIQDLGIPILKQFMEYCIYDSNLELDKGWLTTESPCTNCEMDCIKNSTSL